METPYEVIAHWTFYSVSEVQKLAKAGRAPGPHLPVRTRYTGQRLSNGPMRSWWTLRTGSAGWSEPPWVSPFCALGRVGQDNVSITWGKPLSLRNLPKKTASDFDKLAKLQPPGYSHFVQETCMKQPCINIALGCSYKNEDELA